MATEKKNGKHNGSSLGLRFDINETKNFLFAIKLGEKVVLIDKKRFDKKWRPNINYPRWWWWCW